jgi:hypothetical protein
MTYENIKAKLKTAWYLVWGSISGRALLFHCLLTNGAIYWRLPISAFIQRRQQRYFAYQGQMEHQDLEDLQLWNSFSYYPSVTCFDFLIGQRCKYLVKMTKKLFYGQYLFTLWIGHIRSLILAILSILKFLTSTSVLTFWLLITVIMQLNLIIVFCGAFLALLLQHIGRIIKSKLQSGT